MNFADFPLQSLMPITGRPPIVFVRGEGSFLWDHAGRRYLDFIQGWAVNTLGHSPAVITEVLIAQSRRLLTPSPAYFNEPSLQLAAKLVAHSHYQQVFFANSGGEANEGAIKLARRWGTRHKGGAFEIITFDHSFHGRTLATMSASGKLPFRPLFEPKVPGFKYATLNDIDSVRTLITERTVAVMLEPIQGEAGVFPAHDAFLRELRALTHEHQLLLIVDEIQTGMGRTGKLWACEHSAVQADIMTLAKGLGGGVPLAALLTTQSVSCFEPGDQGGTFNGNPLMTAVGCAVLDAVVSPGFLAHVAAVGLTMRDGLLALSARFDLGEVRGRGLLLGLALKNANAKQVADAAMEQGLLLNAPRADTLRFMPSLNVTADEVGQMLEIVDRVFRHVRR